MTSRLLASDGLPTNARTAPRRHSDQSRIVTISSGLSEFRDGLVNICVKVDIFLKKRTFIRGIGVLIQP